MYVHVPFTDDGSSLSFLNWSATGGSLGGAVVSWVTLADVCGVVDGSFTVFFLENTVDVNTVVVFFLMPSNEGITGVMGLTSEQCTSSKARAYTVFKKYLTKTFFNLTKAKPKIINPGYDDSKDKSW